MKTEMLQRIKEIYRENRNIMKYLQKIQHRDYNTSEDIMISYDFQAGTYNTSYTRNPQIYEAYHNEICNNLDYYIQKLQCGGYKILEAGIGEGTTFGPVMNRLSIKPQYKYGFDISWSRIKECNLFLEELNVIDHTFIFVGDIFNIPLKNNSVDIVYTAHALEPNGGKEKELLAELYRVASKYIIMFEPGYEFANEEQKNRMEYYGYVKNLAEKARELNYNVIEHRLLNNSLNEKNPTAITVIQKNVDTIEGIVLCDPLSKGELIKGESSYFSEDCLLAYPIIEGIPCLNIENGVLATKYV